LIRPVCIDLAHGHGLDQSQIEGAAMAPSDKIGNFILVAAPERHGVEGVRTRNLVASSMTAIGSL
jgi:hypothetical protein